MNVSCFSVGQVYNVGNHYPRAIYEIIRAGNVVVENTGKIKEHPGNNSKILKRSE